MLLVSLPPPAPGPQIPLVRSLPKASPVPGWGSGEISAYLRDLPGAVVVVEEEAFGLSPLPSLRSILVLRMKLLAAGLPSPLSLSSGIAVWADPSVIRSGGNAVHKVYSFGGASF